MPPRKSENKPQVGLAGLLAFESVARHLNFARAAAQLEVTPTAISKTVKHLESQLGVRLFDRTTRSVGLTEEGARLLDALAPALEQIKRSVQQLGDSAARPKGVLRINTSYVAFASLIAAHQAEFSRRYPDVTLDVTIDNSLTDIVATGFDAGIRPRHVVQRDLIGVPLSQPQRVAVVGAPAYLAARGSPKVPKDLLDHECIRQRIGRQGRFLEWRFKAGSRTHALDVRGKLIYSDMRCTLDAATQGLGLAYVYRQFAEPSLRRGELVAVLEKYCGAREPFYLYFANRAQMPGKLRAFIDFVQSISREAEDEESMG